MKYLTEEQMAKPPYSWSECLSQVATLFGFENVLGCLLSTTDAAYELIAVIPGVMSTLEKNTQK